MTQDRLPPLATISNENDIANQLDLTNIVEEFAEANARRNKLNQTLRNKNINFFYSSRKTIMP